MRTRESKELLSAIAHWLTFERLCSPNVQPQWERVVSQPIRRFLTAMGYYYQRTEWVSGNTWRREGGSPRFDYAFGRSENNINNVMEVKGSNTARDALLRDLAKLHALGQGDKYLLLVGPNPPTNREITNRVLSVDVNEPNKRLRPEPGEDELWNNYRGAWDEFMKHRRGQPTGRGYTPNCQTTLIMLEHNNMVFAAIYRVKSTVGG